MAKKNLLLPVALADNADAGKNTAAGSASSPAAAVSYYAKPDIGGDTESLYNAAKAAEQAAKDSQNAYTQSHALLQEKQEALAKWAGVVQMAQQKFAATGSASDAATLERYRSGILTLQTEATAAKKVFYGNNG